MSQFSFLEKPKREFGGSLLKKGKRKTERVLDCRKPMHFVLKAQKTSVLYSQKRRLQFLLKKYAQRFGIKVYSESVQKNHWHFCIRISNRLLYRQFIRALTGTIARELGRGLWQLRPYSRVLSWGKDFLNVLDYILLNECEAKGIVPYAIRKTKRPTNST